MTTVEIVLHNFYQGLSYLEWVKLQMEKQTKVNK
jgi:hypothetical protein